MPGRVISEKQGNDFRSYKKDWLFRVLPIMPDRPVRDQWNYPRENGTTLFERNKTSSRAEVFHLRFDRNFYYSSVKWDWKNNFRSNRTERSKRTTSGKRSIYVSTETSGNFGITESTNWIFTRQIHWGKYSAHIGHSPLHGRSKFRRYRSVHRFRKGFRQLRVGVSRQSLRCL